MSIYKRALGVSLTTFAIALAIGLAFSVMLGSFTGTNYAAQLLFWTVLIIAVVAVLIANFISAHTSTIRFMNEVETSKHFKYVGAWLVILVLGMIIFTLPLVFFNSSFEPIVLLFSFGGVFWVLYLSAILLFKQPYHEVAIGAIAMWVMFLVGITGMLNSNAGTNTANFALFTSMISLILISGVTGVVLLFNSGSYLSSEFERYHSKGSTKSVTKNKRRRRKR